MKLIDGCFCFSIEDYWDWSENVLADSLHLQDSMIDEEHGYLLGPARMRLIRSTEGMENTEKTNCSFTQWSFKTYIRGLKI